MSARSAATTSRSTRTGGRSRSSRSRTSAVDDGWVDTSGLPPLPVEALKPEDARRVIVVVVDDLRMSFESMYYARRGIGEFLERQFQPGDLGMIVTTSGTGGSNQLTYNPTALKAATSRLRFSL